MLGKVQDELKIEQGRQMLAARGLNLFAVLDLGRLPGHLLSTLPDKSTVDYSRLIMIGHGGVQMWKCLREGGLQGADPVDEYSVGHATGFVERFLGGCDHRVLYPGNTLVPLQQLGSIAGWHHDSPLGLGVNTEFGPWFGYRAVLLVRAEIPVSTDPPGTSPCSSCTDKPCISTCPVNALSPAMTPDIKVCVEHRTVEGSRCAYACHARQACPAGSAHRYDDEQIRYFYGRSLDSIKAYMASS